MSAEASVQWKDIEERWFEVYCLFIRRLELSIKSKKEQRPIRYLLLKLMDMAEDEWLSGNFVHLLRACMIIRDVEEIARRLRIKDVADLAHEIRGKMRESLRLLREQAHEPLSESYYCEEGRT